MFRRKGGDQEEEGRSQEGGEERHAPTVVVEGTRRGVPSKTVVFHPDVPSGSPSGARRPISGGSPSSIASA